MAVADNPLQKKLDSAISDLIGDAKKHSASTDKSWQLTTNKEVFHESFRKSWEYLYLPLGAMFSVPKFDYGIPPGAPSAAGRFSAPLSLMFTDNGDTEVILDKDYATADFQNIKRDFVPSTEPWKLFFLSELLSELIWLIKMSVPNELVYLAGFKAQGALANTRPPIGLDVFSIWAFDAHNPKLVGSSEISFDSCTENIGLRWGILHNLFNEYGGKEFATRSSESPNGNKIKSVVCHREFLDNSDCCGVLLFGRDSSTESVTVHWNGVELDATCASCNSEFRQKSLYPLAEAMKDKVSVQHPFSAFIMFGASPDLEGVYGQTLGSSDTVGLPINVSGTFIEVGLHCALHQALAISRGVHAGIRSLQAELFAYMAKVNMERLDEERARLSIAHRTLENVRKPISDVTLEIARMQSRVQFVNLHLAPGHDGLFFAYSQVLPLFEDGETLQINSLQSVILIDHTATYKGREVDATWLLSYVIHSFIGLEIIVTVPTATDESKAALASLSFGLSELKRFADLDLRAAKGLWRMMHPDNLDKAEETEQLTHKLLTVSAERISTLQLLKQRYHTVLKATKPTEIAICEVSPYLAVATSLERNTRVWRNCGFASHAPLLRFLDKLLQSRNARDPHVVHYYQISKFSKSFVFTMIARIKTKDGAGDREAVCIFDEPLTNIDGLIFSLNAAKGSVNNGAGENEITGSGQGNTVSPIFDLIKHSLAPKDCHIEKTNSSFLKLTFDRRLSITIGALDGGTSCSSIFLEVAPSNRTKNR